MLRPALLAAAVLFAACADSPPTVERAPGHGRMLESLAAIAESAARDNPYLGEGPLTPWRERLAGLAEGEPALRWRCLREVAAHEMRLGRVEPAIEHLSEAYQLLPRLPDMPPEAAEQTVLALAVAWMRQAELKNCCAAHNADSCILPLRGGGLHRDEAPVRRAIVYLDELLDRARPGTPNQLTARWLRNVAAMALDDWPDGLPVELRIEPRVWTEGSLPRFPNRAHDAGVASFDLAGGAVAEDFDGDGWIDLFVTTSDPAGPSRLYVNRGDGTFEERTSAAGLDGITGGLNANSADYDGDGDVDLLVLRGGWWRDQGRHPNSLLRNDGQGNFEDVTFAAGLGDVHYPTQTAGWADYDRDGDLDLYVGNENDPGVPAPGQLFRNRGDGTFEDVAAGAGVSNDRYAKAVAWGDYDGDGWIDLYVSNMAQPNRLYRNRGDGTFEDVAPRLGVTRPIVSFPAWFWDYDNDGALDLFVAAYGGPRLEPDVWYVVAGYLGLPQPAELPALYRNDGGGGFAEVGRESGFTRPSLPMGANYGDVDNDGFPDVYLGTGYPFYEGLMPNELHRNVGGARFVEATWSSGLGHLQKGHGVAFADFDRDGDLDLYAQMGGQYSGDPFANALFDNPGTPGRSLFLRLTGTRSNRLGVGARIRVDVDGPDGPRQIRRQAGSGGSFGASPLTRQHVGFRADERVTGIEVQWPVGGPPERFELAEADAVFLELTEGSGRARALPYGSIERRAKASAAPDPSTATIQGASGSTEKP